MATAGSGVVVPPMLSNRVHLREEVRRRSGFSGCAGFDADFMGVTFRCRCPARLRAGLAFLNGSASVYTLMYHHFSSIQHAVRRVPDCQRHQCPREVSLRRTGRRRVARGQVVPRQPHRLRRPAERRVLQEERIRQRTPGAARGCGVGRLGGQGEACRRSDVQLRQRGTQVPALNRFRFGTAGMGTTRRSAAGTGHRERSGQAARICVFNGPMFDNDDPVFNGVQVALSFYKVVVWYNGGGKLRSTCYQLSQAKLVGAIEFEVLRFNEIFKTHQVPIAEDRAGDQPEFSRHHRQQRHKRRKGRTARIASKRTQFAAGGPIAALPSDCLSPGPSPERYRYPATTAIARAAPASVSRT